MTGDPCRPFAGILLYRDLSVFDSITTPLVRQDALKSKFVSCMTRYLRGFYPLVLYVSLQRLQQMRLQDSA